MDYCGKQTPICQVFSHCVPASNSSLGNGASLQTDIAKGPPYAEFPKKAIPFLGKVLTPDISFTCFTQSIVKPQYDIICMWLRLPRSGSNGIIIQTCRLLERHADSWKKLYNEKATLWQILFGLACISAANKLKDMWSAGTANSF